MKFTSIRYQLILAISVFIALILGLIAAGTYGYFRQATQQLIFDQQFSTISSLASVLDGNIVSAHEALIEVAKVAPAESTSNQRSAQLWLDNRVGIRNLFKHSLIILDKTGTLVASVPAEPTLYGTSFSEREYFKQTMTSGKPTISSPFITAMNNRPVVMMTAIIRADDGSVKGLLCGSVELLEQEGIFGFIKNTRIGSTGYLYLFDPNRTVIIHPDASRIMKRDVMPGANVLFDQALEGFEGSGETVSSKGVPLLSSFKRLPSTGWILAVNYPIAEAYQPIIRFRNYYLLGMLVVLLAAVALAWKLGSRIVRPLENLVRQVRAMAHSRSSIRSRLDVGHDDELGKLAGSFNSLLDEVQQREQEAETLGSEVALLNQRFSVAADSARLGVWDWQVVENRLVWDKWMYALYGIREEDFSGAYQAWQYGLHPEDKARGDEEINQALRGEKPFDTEFRVVWPNEEVRYIKAAALVLRDDDGKPLRMIGVNYDITELKRNELALRQSRDLAESANRAKSLFLDNMSHELRTPMNGVIGMAGLLLDSSLTQAQRDYAETVRTSGENLLGLINDILDFSNIEADRVDIEIIDFNLRTTIEDAVELLALRARAAGLKLSCLIDPDVPMNLKGDPGRLRQVLYNVARNAIKFTPKGKVSIRVRLVSGTDRSALIRFEIEDTGIGIAREHQSALFTPFSQADSSTTRKYGGTGIGLAICKQLTELMGGDIGLESTENQGSTFWFTLRLEKQTEVKRLHMAPSPEKLDAARVLVVEVDDTNRKLMAALLAAWGLPFEMAGDGETALKLLSEAVAQKNPFLIALLDQQLPDMDGRELGRQIMADPLLKSTLMIMVTSVGQRGDAAVMEKIGFAGYLPKPVRKEELHDCIGLALARVNDGLSESGIITRYSVAEAAKQGLGVRILLADDNIVNQKVTQAMLSKIGYSVDVVANGLEAVHALELIAYDLVLMDCQMPEMDGYEATRLIRDATSRVIDHAVPVVAMTANALAGDREKCLAAGMTDYLAKPVSFGALCSKIGELLNQAKSVGSVEVEVPAPGIEAGREGQDLTQMPVLDTGLALEMMDGDMAMLLMMLPMVSKQMITDRLEIASAVDKNDSGLIKKRTHRLKGSLAQIGAARSQRLCALLEAAALQTDFGTCIKLQELLFTELDALSQSIEAFLAMHSSEAR
ncbi:MAG: response regulator [Betaproteobacteria bacterium]